MDPRTVIQRRPHSRHGVSRLAIAAARPSLLSASCVQGPAMKSVEELVEPRTQPFLVLAGIKSSLSLPLPVICEGWV